MKLCAHMPHTNTYDLFTRMKSPAEKNVSSIVCWSKLLFLHTSAAKIHMTVTLQVMSVKHPHKFEAEFN